MKNDLTRLLFLSVCTFFSLGLSAQAVILCGTSTNTSFITIPDRPEVGCIDDRFNDFDNAATISADVALPGGVTVTDVSVTIEVQHSWVGDLSMVLVSPDGKSLPLFHKPGTNLPTGCGRVDDFGSEASDFNPTSFSTITFSDSNGSNVDPEDMGAAAGSGDLCLVESCDFFPNGDGLDLTGSANQPAGFSQIATFADFNASGDGLAGTWTLYVVDGGSGDVGTLSSLEVCIAFEGGGPPAAPANDLCDDAISLAINQEICGNTDLATRTGAVDCAGTEIGDESGCPDASGGIWYAIEGDGFEITIRTQNTNFDTEINVYTGTCDNLSCLVANDDAIDEDSEVTFDSEIGVTYYIYVDGNCDERGDFCLFAECTPEEVTFEGLPETPITVDCDAVPPPAEVTATIEADVVFEPFVFISEFHYDNAGNDENEFIELTGTAGFDLEGYSLVLYNGANGLEYNTVNIHSGSLIDNEGDGFGALAFDIPGIQNGGPDPDGFALVDDNGVVLEFLSYEGEFTAVDGPAMGMMSTDVGIEEDGGTTADESLQRVGEGCSAADFTWEEDIIDDVEPTRTGPGKIVDLARPAGDATPGTINEGLVFDTEECETSDGGTVAATVIFMEERADGDCPNEFTLTRTFTVERECGEDTSFVQTINVIDTIAPTFDVMVGDTTIECDELFEAPEITGTDNCDAGDVEPAVWINEFHYDDVGGDMMEFVELAGTAGFDLTGYILALYNGNGDMVYEEEMLSGIIPDQMGGFGTVVLNIAGIQNGEPDGIALIDDGGTVVLFISYEPDFAGDVITAVDGPAAGATSTDIGVSEAGGAPEGTSLQLIGSGSSYEDFTWAGGTGAGQMPINETAGATNEGQTFAGTIVATSTEVIIPGINDQNFIIQRTFRLEDACGNADSVTQTITVEDNTAPVITCPGVEIGDPINYTVEAYAFSYTSIVGTGTLVASGDDNSSIDSEIFGPVALGAPVELYGMPITAVTPSTNGYITTDLTDEGGDLSNDCPLPAGTSTPFNSVGIRLYPLHDDLESDSAQDPDAGVYYQYFAASPYTSPDGSTTGASVFQWIGDHFNAVGPAELDFQAVLFDNGEIVYLYNEVGTEMGSGSTQGIQSGGPDPALGTTISCNTAGSVVNGSASALIPQFEMIEVEEFVIGCDENSDPFLDGEGTIDGMATGTVEAGTLSWTDGTSGAIGSVTSTVAGIPAGATVTDINFTIQADHSWVGDLELSIESPDGTSLMFLADPCNNGNSDNANVTFDSDAGPFDCQTVTSDNGTPDDCSMDFLGGASMTGSMQPQFGDLSIFNGENAAGDWRLDIVDDAGGDGGCLYTFQVEVSYTAVAPGAPNPIVGAATATDNCDPNVEITFEDSTTQTMDGSCSQFTYEIFRSFIATDATGNADTCVQMISVVDTLAPDLMCTTITVDTDDLGNIELDDTDLDGVTAGTVDNCDADYTAEFSQTEFDCSDIDPETNQITVDVLAMDACGNDTMCTVQLDVMPQALDYDFACITEINVTLDEDCSAELVPEMVLSGEFICLDLFDFEIVVMDDDPTNGAIIDGCGTFQYSITEVSEDFDAANFETCWGFVNAEDKTSPELEEDGEIVAPAPLYCDDLARINVNELPNGVSRCWIQSGQTGQTLNGSMNPALRQRLLAGGGIPNFVDGCSDVEICVNDQVENIGACEDMTITRIFTARDGISCEAEAGEENAPTVYSYEIIFTRPTIDDVDAITPTAEFECNDVLDLLPPNQFGDENPTPEFDDFPFFDDGSGPVYLTESFCNLGATFRDGPRIVTCENTYKFVRTFTVIDWCEPETIRDFTQLVKVGDFDAPVITAPTQDLNFNGIPDQEEGLGPIFFSTSNPDCSANFIIPAGDADDNCDDDPEVIALIYPNGNTDGAAVGPFQVGGPAFGIPVGVHTLRYIARDACDNADTLDVPLEVGDRTAPVAICENGLDISLGGAGQAQLCGEDIDQASYDECSDITRLIAFVGANNLPLNDAQTLALTGIAQGGWRECITLTCELLDDDPDSPDFVAVGLLVTDASQNSNSCWLDVLVEDKLPPLCVAPGPVTTTCDDEDILSLPQDLNQAAQDDPTTTFAQLDQIFGSANGLDNCPDFDITQMVVDTRNSCGVGQILRSFFVTDGEGFTSTNPCSQTITVLGIHDYTIRFPEDFGSEACVEPDYDGVTFEERGCDLITTTTRIDTFEATADECYKLRITYEVLNWCEYSTEADPYEVPRDADNDDFLEEPTWVHVLPRDESTLSDDIAYLDSDANRFNGFISPLDLHDPNGQVFGASTQPYGTDESRGAFLYRQFIKVYDDVAPEVTDVTGDLVFEDEDGNCAEPVVLTIEVDDECTTEEDYTATAQLDPFFEDIDLDGILTLADFVPTADPSLQPNVVNNNDGTFTVSFNVELPLGRHAVRLRATDGCGNAETILIIFEVIDDKAPTPVCINGLTATLMPDGNGGGMAAIWANEYVVSGGEDCTGPVKFAIYHPDDFEALDNGTLIPNVIDTGIVLDCDDEGMLIVRVYAIDGNGNADYCETTLSVQAFQPNTCEGGDDGGNIFGLIESPAGTATPNVEVSISDDGSMSQMNVTDQSGEYSFTELALGEDYTIEPTLEAEVNVATAVTTFDILLINRHILAIAELESPYQHVVADVNMDGQINVLDVVHIRMVIMGQRTDYPQGPTWRFADRDYAFSADPGNWASEAFAELHNINDLPGDILGADFYALEMGNVSEGVIAENGLLPEDGEARSRAVLTTESLQLTAGNSYELPFRAADLYGFQGTLELAAGLELMDITYGALHAQHVNLEAAAEGLIALSYDEVAGTTTEELFRLTVRATRDGALSELLSLTDRMTRAEGYPLSGGVADLNLDFTTAPLAADEFSLGQNAPNPVDRATQIAFTLPRAATATLTVRDVQGRTLLVREIEAGAGTNLLTLRREELGAAGVLSYTLTAGEFTATKQMVIR